MVGFPCSCGDSHTVSMWTVLTRCTWVLKNKHEAGRENCWGEMRGVGVGNGRTDTTLHCVSFLMVRNFPK